MAPAQDLLDTDRGYLIVLLTGIVAAVILFVADRMEKRPLKCRPQATMR